MTTATDLSSGIWNAIADELRRNGSQREIFFSKVTKVDTNRKILWADDFGGLSIPLVSFSMSFSYFDTVTDSADTVTGAVANHQAWRGDKTQKNTTYRTEIVMPKVGETIVILDVWGQKRFPICIGVLQSKGGYWEGEVAG